MSISSSTPAAGARDVNVRVEPATIEDLPDLVQLVEELMGLQHDFIPDREAHTRGIALILEQPSRGRIFVLRNDDRIFGMVNLLFTISTAVGGLVILLEDFVIHPNHRGLGYGTMLVDYVADFANKKNFKRITLLADKAGSHSQHFFKKVGFEDSHMIPMRRVID
ncbi:MAG: GNAT family N-acetyltransferase [Verrucomicrobiae bacterium]|nr:GNAT family N-acetyltransferase [Verrucomicrobiae bacterium]NNJ41755.1 GNAT family N-acetyltransferase [Akkermansiaceae bacterium]